MIFLFSLSQVSSLVVSLFNYNKDYVTIFIEEETEKEESQASDDDKLCIHAYTYNPIAWIVKDKLYIQADTRIITCYSHKPETPPPDFC